MKTAYVLYTPEGFWFASVPNKELRDQVCESYFDRNLVELRIEPITQAEYASHISIQPYCPIID